MTAKQHGFALIEVVLIIVVLAVAAGGGWYAYHRPAGSAVSNISKPSAPVPQPFKPDSQVKDFSSVQVPSKPSTSSVNPNLTVDGKAHSSLAQFIDSSEYQGVRLESGTIYVGKLTEIHPGQLQLGDTFVLVTSPCTAPTYSTGGAPQNTVCVSLKLNSINPQPIRTADVAVWANLPADNIYAKAILQFKKTSQPK